MENAHRRCAMAATAATDRHVGKRDDGGYDANDNNKQCNKRDEGASWLMECRIW